LGDLGATYDDNLRLTGKCVVDLLVVLIELSLGVTRLRRYERISARGPVDPKFQVEGVAPTNHYFPQKTRLNDLSYGIKIWTVLSSVLSLTIHAFDRQTDRQNYHR